MLRTFFKNRSGAAAVEFGFIAPVLVGVMAVGWNVWQAERSVEQAKTAVHAGALYYSAGGTNDTTAQTVAKNAWVSAPANASVSAARSCYCGGVLTDCTVACGSGQVRTVYVTLIASGAGQGVFGTQSVTQQETVRVQ